jgi:hypothetical protein
MLKHKRKIKRAGRRIKEYQMEHHWALRNKKTRRGTTHVKVGTCILSLWKSYRSSGGIGFLVNKELINIRINVHSTKIARSL